MSGVNQAPSTGQNGNPGRIRFRSLPYDKYKDSRLEKVYPGQPVILRTTIDGSNRAYVRVGQGVPGLDPTNGTIRDEGTVTLAEAYKLVPEDSTIVNSMIKSRNSGSHGGITHDRLATKTITKDELNNLLKDGASEVGSSFESVSVKLKQSAGTAFDLSVSAGWATPSVGGLVKTGYTQSSTNTTYTKMDLETLTEDDKYPVNLSASTNQMYASVPAQLLARFPSNSGLICTKSVGGLPLDHPLSGKSAIEILTSMLCSYVRPSISASWTTAPGTYEVGTSKSVTLVSVTLSTQGSAAGKSIAVTYNGSTKGSWSGTLNRGSSQSVSVSGVTFNPTTPTSYTVTATLTDTQNNTATATATYNFRFKYYYGASGTAIAAGSTPSDNTWKSTINGWSSQLSTTHPVGSYTVATTNTYIYFAIPVGWTQPNEKTDFYVGGYLTEFVKSGSFSHTNASGGTTDYYLYRSPQVYNGNVTVEVR